MLELHFKTGESLVDSVLAGLLGIYEMAFPERIKAFYLLGSYAYGSPVPTSDIDINIVFRDANAPTQAVSAKLGFGVRVSEDEEQRFFFVNEQLRLLSPIDLGLGARQEAEFRSGFNPNGDQVLRFLYGEDLLAGLSARPADDDRLRSHRWKKIQRAYDLIYSTHTRADRTDGNLPLPDENGPFYGYDEPRRDGFGTAIKSMEPFFNACVFPVCTARLEMVGVSVTRKDKVAAAYREHVGDEWSEFVEQAFLLIRETWHYRIPEDQSDQSRLRELCRTANQFCARFLDLYRATAQARADDGAW